MTAKRVFLHVGEPKCGTTFLQDLVWNNRAVLARQGLVLPGSGEQQHYRAAQDLRAAAQRADDPSGAWTGEWDALARQARRAEQDVLIAHEMLVGADEAQAARALASVEPAEVHVVLTVRSMTSVLPAEWQETVKHGNRRSWDGWLGDIVAARDRPAGHRRWFWQAHDTLDVLRRWGGSLPPERVHVIPLPRADAPRRTLWDRYAAVLGVDPDSVVLDGSRANASLGVAETQLLVRLNRALPADLPDWHYVRAVKHALATDVLARRPATARLRLPPERAAWAREHTAEVCAGLRAAGYDIVGDLADLADLADLEHLEDLDAAQQPAGSRPAIHPGQVSDAELLDAALACLVATIADGYRSTSARPLPAVTRTLRRWSVRYPALERLRDGVTLARPRMRRAP